MSQPTPVLAINQHFRKLKDPRRNHRKRHLLLDIIAIAICGVICGCNDWQQIAVFGRERRDWLMRFLRLPNGIPSHDTFERVFDRVDPQAFQSCFRSWVAAISDALAIPHIAIDGKTLRGSASSKLGAALHLVSAWATASHLSLGQVAVDSKSNEITAIPQLLELLDVHGALVTIDAMGCQKAIAAKIRERGGDYLLTVKDNQPTLLEDIQTCFTMALDANLVGVQHDQYTTEERGHGRIERRSYIILTDPTGLRQAEQWDGLRVIGMCVSERTVGTKTSTEVRYFIGSRVARAKTYAQALRGHWAIENNLHWQMDVHFGEDKSRVTKRHAAENFAALRRMALMMLKQHPDKGSIACKRLAAALSTSFLEEILRGGINSGKA
jgi:predicted transposase YbfD/YdcC